MPPKAVAPRVLSGLTRAQIVYVAHTYYGTQLAVKDRAEVLKNALYNLMVAVKNCENAGCCGGQPGGTQCDPSIHLFSPAEYTDTTSEELLVDNNGTLADMSGILGTSQHDLPVSSSPSASPFKDHNPLADGDAQRRELALRALADSGFSLADIVPGAGALPEDVSRDQITVGGSPHPSASVAGTGAGTGAIKKGLGALRSLAGALGKSTPVSTPATVTSGPTPRVNVIPPASTGTVPPALGPTVPPAGPVADAPVSSTQMMMNFFTQLQTQAALDRAEDRRRFDQQVAASNALVNKMLEKSQKPDSSADSKGRMSLVEPINKKALAMSGCSFPAMYSLTGDTSSLDMSQAHKHLKSGRHGLQKMGARVAVSWPNHYLHPALYDNAGDVTHDKLTKDMWSAGFATKIFAEIHPSRTNTPEHNQMGMFMKLLRLSEIHTWEVVRGVSDSLFSALERGSLTWDSWEALMVWWDQMMEGVKLRAS